MFGSDDALGINLRESFAFPCVVCCYRHVSRAPDHLGECSPTSNGWLMIVNLKKDTIAQLRPFRKCAYHTCILDRQA